MCRTQATPWYPAPLPGIALWLFLQHVDSTTATANGAPVSQLQSLQRQVTELKSMLQSNGTMSNNTPQFQVLSLLRPVRPYFGLQCTPRFPAFPSGNGQSVAMAWKPSIDATEPFSSFQPMSITGQEVTRTGCLRRCVTRYALAEQARIQFHGFEPDRCLSHHR